MAKPERIAQQPQSFGIFCRKAKMALRRTTDSRFRERLFPSRARGMVRAQDVQPVTYVWAVLRSLSFRGVDPLCGGGVGMAILSAGFRGYTGYLISAQSWNCIQIRRTRSLVVPTKTWLLRSAQTDRWLQM